MDFNKVYDDLRKHGIHFIMSNISIHSTTITGTTGNRFNHNVILSISEHTFSGSLRSIQLIYDVCLQIDGKMVIQEFLIDEITFNKKYLRVLHEIKQIIKQSATEKYK